MRAQRLTLLALYVFSLCLVASTFVSLALADHGHELANIRPPTAEALVLEAQNLDAEAARLLVPSRVQEATRGLVLQSRILSTCVLAVANTVRPADDCASEVDSVIAAFEQASSTIQSATIASSRLETQLARVGQALQEVRLEAGSVTPTPPTLLRSTGLMDRTRYSVEGGNYFELKVACLRFGAARGIRFVKTLTVNGRTLVRRRPGVVIPIGQVCTLVAQNALTIPIRR